MNFHRHIAPLLAVSMSGILFAFLHSPKESHAATEPPAFKNQSLPIEQRIQDVISRMTLEEVIRLCFGVEQPGVVQFYGVPRLGIPSLLQTDGPRGIAGAPTATSFPSGIGLTASWDYNLIYQTGVATGQEARAVGRTMVLGPAINIDRDPLDGRFFEYATEDPYLNARIAPAEIQGLQSQKVAACVKHFVCNNREINRGSYMSNVGERALHEIYFPGFRAAVKLGGTWGVMTAANGINGFWPRPTSIWLPRCSRIAGASKVLFAPMAIMPDRLLATLLPGWMSAWRREPGKPILSANLSWTPCYRVKCRFQS